MPESPVYLDCNATTPVDPRVIDVMMRVLTGAPSNAGSRTHEFGTRAMQTVHQARAAIAAVVDSEPEAVLFTSGSTESSNLAILGLAPFGEDTGRKHVVCSSIEHKAVLEPIECLRRRGFEVTLVPPDRRGVVSVESVMTAVRPDTLLVCLMHVNNETGVVQPISTLATALEQHGTFVHVDAAQGFGKDLDPLRNPRIDMLSVSGHKIYGPQGIGALIVRRRHGRRPPLAPLVYGGGQERGLRAGTLPVHLIAGFGEAARIAVTDHALRLEACRRFRDRLLLGLQPLCPVPIGDQAKTLPHVIALAFPGLDSEAVILALKDIVAISNGSACTSASYSESHVLKAMALPADQISSVTRWSWCHATTEPDWRAIVNAIQRLQ